MQDKTYKRNFILNIFLESFWGLGVGFVVTTTILSVFVSRYTSSKAAVGLLFTIPAIGSAVMPVLTAFFIRRWKRVKWPMILVHVAYVLTWLTIAVFTKFSAGMDPKSVLPVFFLVYGAGSVLGGIMGPMYFDYIGKIFPSGRGAFFGIAISASNGLSILGAFLAGKFLDKFAFPAGFALCFFSAFLAQGLSLLFLGLNKEKENVHAVEERHSFREYLGILSGILKNDKYFLRFLVAQIIMCLSGMAGAFYGVYADQKLHLTGSMLGGLTMMLVAGQTIATVLLGLLGDAKGHKTSLVIAALSSASAALLAIFSNTFALFSLVFFLVGIGGSPAFVSIINMLLEMNEKGERSSYIALNNTLTAPFAAAAPLIGALLIKNTSYAFVFGLAAALILAGLAILVPARKNTFS